MPGLLILLAAPQVFAAEVDPSSDPRRRHGPCSSSLRRSLFSRRRPSLLVLTRCLVVPSLLCTIPLCRPRDVTRAVSRFTRVTVLFNSPIRENVLRRGWLIRLIPHRCHHATPPSDPSDVRRPSQSLGPSTQRARVCLYVTLINNTVDVVSFPSFVQFILHTAATVVWNHSYVTEMAPGQKRHTSQARFSYAAEPRALLCTG